MTLDPLLSRRAVLRLGAGAILASMTESGMLAANPQGFQFVVVNDLHYRDQRCGPWFERVVASICATRPRPAFVVLAGDLAEDGSPEQLGSVKEIFEAGKLPLRYIVGNHDCDASGDFSAFRQIFGPTFNFQFEHSGCQFLGMDSTQGRDVYRTRIPSATFAWLDRTVPTLSRSKPVVLLTHFPLGRNWLRPVNSGAVLERFRDYPLTATLGGHWHGITERDEHGIHLSTNRCCSWWRENHDGSPLKGYALCRFDGAHVTHQFVAVS